MSARPPQAQRPSHGAVVRGSRLERSAADELARAVDALWAIPCPADRDSWWPIIGSALAEGIGEAELLRWCEAGPAFDRKDAVSTIRSLAKRAGSGGSGSLFAEARACGWVPPSETPRDDNRKPDRRGHPTRPKAKAPKVSPPEGAGEPPAADVRAAWESAQPATAAHAYVARKLMLPFGLRVRQEDGALLVPVLDGAGELQSLQAIPAEPGGKKLNARGAPMTGGRFIVGGPIDGGDVYLAEGIAAAMTAHQATARPAVCCFGAGNVARIAADLRARHPGARLVVVADRGKEGDAERIAVDVDGAFVALPEEMPTNADINDVHVDQGLDAAAEILMQAIEPGRPDYARLDNLDTDPPPPRRWIVREWLPRGSVTALFGSGGIGKSLLVQQLATHVACGVPVLGQDVTLGPVVAFLCEDDNDELRRRQRAIFERLGRSSTYSAENLHIEGRAGLDNAMMRFGPDRAPIPGAMIGLVERECRRFRPALLVLDNIAQLYGGNENDRHEVTTFANHLTGIARRHDCAVLLLGHVAKVQGSEFSGSTAWEAAVRTRLWMERREDGLIGLHKKKANYSAQESVLFEYQDGTLVEIDARDDGAADSLLMAEAEQALLKALDTYTARQVATSQVPTARTFLPRMAFREGLLGAVPEKVATQALARLIDSGEILLGQELGWRKADRHPATGLARRTAI